MHRARHTSSNNILCVECLLCKLYAHVTPRRLTFQLSTAGGAMTIPAYRATGLHRVAHMTLPARTGVRKHHLPQQNSLRSHETVASAAQRPATAAMSDNYSLWIKASGTVCNKLQQEIATQAKAHDAPLFEPHVTLLPDIQGDKDQIIDTTKQLAQKLQKFRINFLDVSRGTSFHKCVYILVAKEALIMDAGTAAQQMFDKAPADYMPHLSLLYADIDDDTKAAAAQSAAQRLYGEGSDYTTLLMDNGFMAESVSLWYTPVEDKTLASWKRIAEFQLSE